MTQTSIAATAASSAKAPMRMARIVYPILSGLLIIVLWQGIVTFAQPAPYLLPAPVAVVTTLVSQFPMLIYHTGVTALETLIAFILSILISLPLALMIARFRWFEDAVYPLLVTSQAVPKVCLLYTSPSPRDRG